MSTSARPQSRALAAAASTRWGPTRHGRRQWQQRRRRRQPPQRSSLRRGSQWPPTGAPRQCPAPAANSGFEGASVEDCREGRASGVLGLWQPWRCVVVLQETCTRAEARPGANTAVHTQSHGSFRGTHGWCATRHMWHSQGRAWPQRSPAQAHDSTSHATQRGLNFRFTYLSPKRMDSGTPSGMGAAVSNRSPCAAAIVGLCHWGWRALPGPTNHSTQHTEQLAGATQGTATVQQVRGVCGCGGVWVLICSWRLDDDWALGGGHTPCQCVW